MMPLACLMQSRELSWEDKIAYIAYRLKPVETKLESVEHRFEPGWYVRTIKIPAEHAFVGRPHKFGHLCKLIEGKLSVMQAEGQYYFNAPAEMRTIPGYMSAVLTQTACVVETWHPNPDDSRNVEVIENNIFDPAEPVLKRGEAIASQIDYKEKLALTGLTDLQVRQLMFESYDTISAKDQPKLIVGDSQIQGLGVFATEKIFIDESPGPGGKTLISRYTNHSVNPNVKYNGKLFIALRDIEPGEELTANYLQVMEAAR